MIRLIRGVLRHGKNFVKNRTETHFSIFSDNRNWDLKFIFRFDNENEKWEKFKILYFFKTKIECPFWPTDYPCMEGIIQKINFMKNEIFIFLHFWKFEKRISFKFRFRKSNFGKLVKVNFIFRFFLQIFSSH